MHLRAAAPAALLLMAALAGCVHTSAPGSGETYRSLGFDGTTWPSLAGQTITVLAYSSFAYAFGEHEKAFENLTGANVVLVTADDAGKVLERAIAERGSPTFDVVYGIDNVLYAKAARSGVFTPYEPLLGSRINASYRLGASWHATAVDHGYIAVNADPRANLTVATLDDVRANAAKFVTQDPRTSSPGLGFLLATVATYGENDDYDYLDYWRDLLAGGAVVVSGWDQAYVNRFSGGYGQFEEGTLKDLPIVTSYTTSPAYEMYYGYATKNGVVLAPNSTFHQIQTAGIASGARNLAAAQAWIEFCLTDAFQSRVAELEAIYPVTDSANATAATAAVYAGRDPAPGSFAAAPFTPEQLDANVERWLKEWTDVYERAQA